MNLQTRLPKTYLDASVRCVLPVCPGRQRLGLGLDVLGQPTVRIALDQRSAQLLLDAVADYVKSFAGNQSPWSSLIPSEAVSVPSEGVNV